MRNSSRINKKQNKTETTRRKVDIYIPDIITVVLDSLVFGQQKKESKNKQKQKKEILNKIVIVLVFALGICFLDATKKNKNIP